MRRVKVQLGESGTPAHSSTLALSFHLNIIKIKLAWLEGSYMQCKGSDPVIKLQKEYNSSMQSIPWKETRKHQVNHSPAKATYAFPKDKRFKTKENALCDSFYNLPTYLGKAPATGIGRGLKTQIINPSLANPSPLNYTIKSPFDTDKRGVKFGLGRENIKCNGLFQRSETPEPGHYQLTSSLSQAKGFSIYSKLPAPELSNQKNPGPGHYKSGESLNSSGRYVLSQMGNCPSYKIKDFKQKVPLQITPGPGQYHFEGESLNPSGKYATSNHESSRCRSFSKSAKALVTKHNIPGPGAYNYYSEFGAKC